MITTKPTQFWLPAVWTQIWPNTDGNWLRIDTKMSSDMPLPTPRWVMSSPSHMTKAVPAVIVSTMSPTFHHT